MGTTVGDLIRDIHTIFDKNKAHDILAALAFVTGDFYSKFIANMTVDEFFEEFKKAAKDQIELFKEKHETTKT